MVIIFETRVQLWENWQDWSHVLCQSISFPSVWVFTLLPGFQQPQHPFPFLPPSHKSLNIWAVYIFFMLWWNLHQERYHSQLSRCLINATFSTFTLCSHNHHPSLEYVHLPKLNLSPYKSVTPRSSLLTPLDISLKHLFIHTWILKFSTHSYNQGESLSYADSVMYVSP